jgi:hypothetical protein
MGAIWPLGLLKSRARYPVLCVILLWESIACRFPCGSVRAYCAHLGFRARPSCARCAPCNRGGRRRLNGFIAYDIRRLKWSDLIFTLAAAASNNPDDRASHQTARVAHLAAERHESGGARRPSRQQLLPRPDVKRDRARARIIESPGDPSEQLKQWARDHLEQQLIEIVLDRPRAAGREIRRSSIPSTLQPADRA